MLDFADVKPSFLNALIITLTVVLMLTFLKYLFGRVRVPGLSDLILAA